MPHTHRFPYIWLVAVLVTICSLLTSTASGHERREVGPYRFIVGFLVEPAFEGLKNGVDLRVSETTSEARWKGSRIHSRSRSRMCPAPCSKLLQLRTIYRDPGHYTADLIPTAPGHYRFRFFGSIKELAVQETFDSTSGGGQFDDVASSVDLQFPVRLPEIREIANAVRGAQQSAQQAHDAALKAQEHGVSTRSLALGGIALGVLSAVIASSALVVVYRKH